MDLNNAGSLTSIILSVGTLLYIVVIASGRLARLEFQVTELWKSREEFWSMQLRLAASDAAARGTGQMNSPFKICQEAKVPFASMAAELRAFCRTLGPNITDLRLFIEIDRCFGNRILEEICLPHKMTQGEALLIALVVARGNSTVNLPDDKPSESGINLSKLEAKKTK